MIGAATPCRCEASEQARRPAAQAFDRWLYRLAAGAVGLGAAGAFGRIAAELLGWLP